MKEIWGIVLAAGLGTRLRPATLHCPKPLIPVAGIEPLFFALWKAHELGIRKFVVNAFHLPEQIASAAVEFEKLLEGSKIHVIRESPEVLGTGGALENIFRKIFVEEKNPPAGVLVQNGDTLSQFPIGRLCADLGISTLAVSQRSDHLKKYNPLYLDQGHKFLGVGAAIAKNAFQTSHFLGSYFISADDVRFLLPQLPTSQRVIDLFSACFYPLQKNQRSPQAIEMFESSDVDNDEKFWFDMTNAEFLLEAQQFLLKRLSNNSLWHRVLLSRYPKGVLDTQNSFVSAHKKHFDLNIRDSVFIDESEEFFEGNRSLKMQQSSLVIRKKVALAQLPLPQSLVNSSCVILPKTPKTTELGEIANSVTVCGESL